MHYYALGIAAVLSLGLMLGAPSLKAQADEAHAEGASEAPRGVDPVPHYHDMYGKAAGRYSFANHDFESFEAWQEAFRPALKAALGLDATKRTLGDFEVTARQVSTLTLDDHIREEWLLQVEPTLELPFYLLRPLTACWSVEPPSASGSGAFPGSLLGR